jgi:hypothetical protein
MIVGDELLHRFIVTKVSEIAEDGHKPFGLEGKAVNVYLGGGNWLE